jgi:hypothetical protein
MALNLITPPVVEPVTLTEMKEFLRVDPNDNSQNNLIGGLVTAARAWAEIFTAKKFVQQTWQVAMDFFPGYVAQKFVGEKFSSPFVSGANAVLVGIRYAVQLPYPPVQKILTYIYQNANGQTTSMISPSINIAAVINTVGQQIQIQTATQHGQQSGASATISGNPTLVSIMGQNTEVITVIDQYNFTLDGTIGTGTAVPGTGSCVFYNYVQDLLSNPARLTPIFGNMWPVARVTVNAVQVQYQCGFAIPIVVSTAASSTAITSAGYTFVATDINQPISIPGAGQNGTALNTVIAAIASPPGTSATLRDPAQAAVSVTSLLVNNSNGDSTMWELIRLGIKNLVEAWYEKRIPDQNNIPMGVKAILYPARDLRL